MLWDGWMDGFEWVFVEGDDVHAHLLVWVGVVGWRGWMVRAGGWIGCVCSFLCVGTGGYAWTLSGRLDHPPMRSPNPTHTPGRPGARTHLEPAERRGALAEVGDADRRGAHPSSLPLLPLPLLLGLLLGLLLLPLPLLLPSSNRCSQCNARRPWDRPHSTPHRPPGRAEFTSAAAVARAQTPSPVLYQPLLLLLGMEGPAAVCLSVCLSV